MPSLPLGFVCAVDKSPTTATLVFQLVVVAATVAALSALSRFRDRVPLRFGLMALGVMIFEVFTAPMWNNAHLGWWAYVYQDVSWVLTMGWSTLFLVVVEGIERMLPGWREGRRYALALLLLTLLAFPLELLVVALGIRSYAPEVVEAVIGGWVGGVPLEMLFYVPVFAGLVIAFYRYWLFVVEDRPLIPVRRIRWGRGFLLTGAAVLLFEFMIEPMVQNRGFPDWSYLFRDISLVMTGVWVLVIAVTATIVQTFLAVQPTAFRMVVALLVATAIALPIEYGLYGGGFRVYGASATANFSGFTIPMLGAPVEIAFAIPAYLALVLAFVRYWEIVLDNRL
jgi:hypothetical protein